MTTKENLIEKNIIAKLEDLKYTYRPDIRNKVALEKNFRQKFESLNHVNLKGDTAKAEFINHFKAVQKLNTQLAQYTDLDDTSKQTIEQALPTDTLRRFKSMYLDTMRELKRKQGKGNEPEGQLQQLEFDLVLFTSSLIDYDYDYIIGLIAKSTQQGGKQKTTLDQIIEMISAYANLHEERGDIKAYLEANREKLNAGSYTDKEIREGYEAFKAQKAAEVLNQIAQHHGLQRDALQAFVTSIMDTHDLRRRTAHRPVSTIKTRLESAARGRASIDGRAATVFAKTCRRAGNFGVECL